MCNIFINKRDKLISNFLVLSCYHFVTRDQQYLGQQEDYCRVLLSSLVGPPFTGEHFDFILKWGHCVLLEMFLKYQPDKNVYILTPLTSIFRNELVLGVLPTLPQILT